MGTACQALARSYDCKSRSRLIATAREPPAVSLWRCHPHGWRPAPPRVSSPRHTHERGSRRNAVLQTSLFYLPTVGSREEIEEWMAGVRDDLYQNMLGELTEQGPARRPARLRLDLLHRAPLPHRGSSSSPPTPSCSTSTSPCRPNASASASSASCCPPRTRSASPRDIAMLDHMSGGRAIAGFRAWLPAALGGRDGAADARHPRRDPPAARRDRRRQPPGLRGALQPRPPLLGPRR